MSVETIYLKPDSSFSSHIAEWANRLGIGVEDYDLKTEDHQAEGLLLINENQDIEKDLDDLHAFFDKKHIPTQKIDINGTLQVAASNFEMWIRNFKCKNILMVGSEKLTNNDNLDRFLTRIETIS